MPQYRKFEYRISRKESGFTLLEIIISLGILTFGLIALLQVFPVGVKSAKRTENMTRAALLAREIYEGLLADDRSFPVIPNAFDDPSTPWNERAIPLPGNGFDDDGLLYTTPMGGIIWVDINNNGKRDADFDGMPEKCYTTYLNLCDGFFNVYPQRLPPDKQGTDFDGDGVPLAFDNGDSLWAISQGFAVLGNDRDYSYDPEPGIDEEYPDGIDNDGDGFIDEDCALATFGRYRNHQQPGSYYYLTPVYPNVYFGYPGDGVDNDGDGEVGGKSFVGYDGRTYQMADGIDNDNDMYANTEVILNGQRFLLENPNYGIDEGIDEEIFNGIDDDGDGLIDEDCEMARYPFRPMEFPPPNQGFFWQIFVDRVPDSGGDGLDQDGDNMIYRIDGIDNDGDGTTDSLREGIDEELKDGRDNDGDGLIDEDCRAAPLPGMRKIIIRITWGGDGIDNDDDGYIDEEAPDGRNNDPAPAKAGSFPVWGTGNNGKDNLVDEDTWAYSYELTGLIFIKAWSSVE